MGNGARASEVESALGCFLDGPEDATAREQTAPDEVLTEPAQRPIYGDRYAVEVELGHGGMGRVLRALDLKLRRRVALKVLAPGRHDEQQRLRFEQEARAAGALNHPNIVAVHDVGDQAGEPYIVSELLEGKTLRTVLRDGPLAPDEVLDLGLQAASGLAAAHRKGIVHRDLKPENVFLTDDGRLKILDFGIAKLLPEAQQDGRIRTDTGSMLGTPAYMSPEQVRGQLADARSDVFSCGAVLYEMLSGRPPFDGATTVDLAYSILHDSPASMPSSGLSRIIERCLEKEPGARYANGAELLDDLTALTRGSRIPVGRTLRRRVTNVAALMLVCTALLALLAREFGRRPGRVKMAVADFSNDTAEKDLDSLSGMLITSLEQSHRLSVLTRSRMFEVLHEIGRPDAERIDETLGRELARKASAKALVLASVRRFGDLYAIDLKVLDPERNEHLFAVREQGRGKESIPGLIDRLAEQVRSGFDEKAADIQATSVPVARSTTSNVEAYRHFFAGEQIYLLKMDWQGAEKEFLEAVRLDPEFALAHLRLAQVSEGSSSVHLERAMLLAARLSERELCGARSVRSILDGHEAEALLQLKECADRYPEDEWTVLRAGDWSFHQGDLDAAAAYLGKVRARNSLNAEAYAHLITIWQLQRRFDLVISAATEQVTRRHDPETYDHLAWAKVVSGDRAGAEQTLQDMERLFPEDPRPFRSRVVAYAHDAEPDKAEELLARPELAGSGLSTKFDWWRGRYKKVMATLDEKLAKDPTDLGAIWGKAWRFASRGQIAAGRQAAKTVALQLPTDKSLFLLYCALGDADAASEMLDSNRLVPLLRSGLRLRVAAVRAHEEGRMADEIAAYEKLAVGDPLYRSSDFFQLGALYLRAQAPRKAIDAFGKGLETVVGNWQQVLDWQGLGVANRPWNLVSVWYQLATAYDRAGEPFAALEWYRRVLRMWSDADPDIPELIDTRARIATLTGK